MIAYLFWRKNVSVFMTICHANSCHTSLKHSQWLFSACLISDNITILNQYTSKNFFILSMHKLTIHCNKERQKKKSQIVDIIPLRVVSQYFYNDENVVNRHIFQQYDASLKDIDCKWKCVYSIQTET